MKNLLQNEILRFTPDDNLDMKTKTIVHLVRHGKVYNPKEIFYGRIPGYFLSDEGQEQVKLLGSHLSNKPISKIYASPLDRAHQTARILQTFFPTIDIEYDERLLEVYSPTQGKPFSELTEFFFNFYKEPLISQGGETMEMIEKRMTEFLSDVVSKHPGEEIIVVSHGDPIMITWKKHKDGSYTIDSIRGDDYLDTATGIELLFEDTTITVKRIIPR